MQVTVQHSRNNSHHPFFNIGKLLLTCLYCLPLLEKKGVFISTVETLYNKIFGTEKICSLYQIFRYINISSQQGCH